MKNNEVAALLARTNSGTTDVEDILDEAELIRGAAGELARKYCMPLAPTMMSYDGKLRTPWFMTGFVAGYRGAW